MTRDFLKNLSLDAETVDKIMAEYGKSIDTIKKANEAELTQVKTINKDLTDKLDGYKDYDSLKDYKTKYDELETKYNSDINALKVDNFVNTTLMGAKVKNLNIVKNALDMSKIELKDGQISGLNEQIDALKETDAYLFGDETKPAPLPNSNDVGLGSGKASKPIDGVEAEFLKRNPDLKI